MCNKKKKEGISQGEKAFVVSTFNKEVLKCSIRKKLML